MLLHRRWPWILLLLLAAATYYGSYYRSGVNFRDEGGTVALGAQRLMAGEVPIRDVALNYNVLWFYPVVWLYEITGVSYVVLRVYCFALSTLAAVLGFLAVERARAAAGRAGIPWLATLTGIVLILVPGMTFKNYMPLLAIANSLLVLHGALAAPRLRTLAPWAAGGGLLVGITFLIRIDLGIFFTALWTGMLLARLAERDGHAARRATAAFAGIAFVWGLAFAAHLPALAHAKSRGYEREFIEQYAQWASRLTLGRVRLLAPESQPAPASAEPAPAQPQPQVSKKILKRPTFADARGQKEPWLAITFVLLAWAPFFPLAILLALAVAQWFRCARCGDASRPLAALTLLGGALTVFPQFWFFRPDPPHLSEFMPGFWVACAGAWLLLSPESRASRIALRALAIFLVLHAALYLARMLQDRWTGTIDARWANKTLFEGDNGVRVFVQNKELEDLKKLRALIHQHATPDDYVVCYPYLPAVNLLANRRTYERDVYVDNATAGRNWSTGAIARFEKYKPAVIVFTDWAINDHDDSRFTKWAAPAVAWIKENYDYAGQLHFREKFQIYTRRR